MISTDKTFESRGYTFKLETSRDDHNSEPWKECDGHGIVSDWTSRDKAPGERILVKDRYGQSKRYYDVAETMKVAIKDGWGIVHCTVCGEASGGLGTSMYASVHKYGPRDHDFKPERKRQSAARAVDADFEYLRAWCADEWEYLVVGVTLLDDDGEETDHVEYLGGVESIKDEYVMEVARELAEEIIRVIEVETPDVVLSEN